jgi:hypothetical protein
MSGQAPETRASRSSPFTVPTCSGDNYNLQDRDGVCTDRYPARSLAPSHSLTTTPLSLCLRPAALHNFGCRPKLRYEAVEEACPWPMGWPVQGSLRIPKPRVPKQGPSFSQPLPCTWSAKAGIPLPKVVIIVKSSWRAHF